ncbi:MAG: hypothetical protein ABIJ97_14935 [Bacteroidota bacterium]
MKKNVFYLFAIAIALTVFVSCNSGVDEVTTNLDDALQSMDSALNELENETIEVIDTTITDDVEVVEEVVE